MAAKESREDERYSGDDEGTQKGSSKAIHLEVDTPMAGKPGGESQNQSVDHEQEKAEGDELQRAGQEYQEWPEKRSGHYEDGSGRQ